MKKRFCCLIALFAFTLTACTPVGEPAPTPTPTATVTPARRPTPTAQPTPTPTPTEAPFSVEEADVPPGDYAPWQEGYAAFLVELRRQEGTLRHWGENASDQELDADPERRDAIYGVSDLYRLYDVDKDGVPELFVQYGSDEATYYTVCYAYREGQVAEVGDFHSGHSSLYTWPEENALLVLWGQMGLAFMEKYSMEDGVLVYQGEIFSEVIDITKQEEYTDPGELVPGAEPIPEFWSGNERRPPWVAAPVLPIYDYGAPPRQDPAPVEEAEVRSAIWKVLEENGPLYGVSGDGFYGDTGLVTLEEYLRPGGAYPYGDEPLTVAEYAWADVNGDGQTDCILRLEEAREGGVGNFYAVLDWQDGAIYAYFFDFRDRVAVAPDGTVYFREYDWWFRFFFYKNQCYDYSVGEPAEWDDLAWDSFPQG